MDSNDDLVDYLKSKDYIESAEVEKAFRNVDRRLFVPESYRKVAYMDRPLPLNHGSTISAPHMVAINTELLDVGKDHRVVELGSGSGYQAAILSELADEVIGIEIEQSLVESSQNVLSSRENVQIFQGSGFETVEGKFDRILYSFGTESIDDAKKFVQADGIIVAPVAKEGGQVLTKWENGRLTRHGTVSFVGSKN